MRKNKIISKKYNNSKLKFYIGDVRDSQSVETAMRDVDYVSMQQLKQVPSCEFFPVEAVKNKYYWYRKCLTKCYSSKC